MNIRRYFDKITIELTLDEAIEFNSNLNGVLDTLSDVGDCGADQLELIVDGLDNVIERNS